MRAFAEAARVDDVVVFCGVQEINTGHTTPEEQQVYLKLLANVKKNLPRGVSLSVNPWHTLMHLDAGKTLREGQDFRLMTDPDGRQSDLCVCPACGSWREYIRALYALYASVEPFIIWVEDDFRFHNHDPLRWGGCFCDWHMETYSRMAGKALTRDEFLKGVLRPGKTHPYRKIWLDCCRVVLQESAAVIGDAVRGVSPGSRVGLMSSLPQVHAAEGRDWRALLTVLAGGLPPVCRVHLPSYSEDTGGKYMIRFNLISMLNRAFLPPNTEVYPELENFPFTRFTKSRKFTRFQLLSALPMDLAGITIDLFDLNGSGIVWEEGYQDTLRNTKDVLTALTDSGIFKWEKEGVCVLADPCSSYTLQTRQGISMEELYPHDAFFGGLLGAYGVPFYYETDPERAGRVAAIGGQYLRNLSAAEIEALFSGRFIILNGDAAEVLVDMGLGRLAGIAACEWVPQNNGEAAYEQVEDAVCQGWSGARASAMILCSDVLRVTYCGEADVKKITGFYNSFRERTADGQAIVGARLLIFPFGRFASPTEIPPMLLNNVRQSIFQRVLGEVCASLPMADGPYVSAYCYSQGGQTALYLINASSDDIEAVTLKTDAASVKGIRAYSSAAGRWEDIPFERRQDGLRLLCPLPMWETAMLVMEC
jgi:hypothetical protein